MHAADGLLQRGRVRLDVLGDEGVAQVAAPRGVLAPVQGVEHVAADPHRGADEPVRARRQPGAERGEADDRARREPGRQRPGVGEARQERRVGGVGAQELVAQPVDEQQRHRPRPRQREAARRSGRAAERGDRGGQHLGERAAPVLGHDGSVHPAVCLLRPARWRVVIAGPCGGRDVGRRCRVGAAHGDRACVGGDRRRGGRDARRRGRRAGRRGGDRPRRLLCRGERRTRPHRCRARDDRRAGAARPRPRRRRGAAGRVAAADAAPVAHRGRPAGRGQVTVTDATSAALARRLLDAGIAHPVAEPPDAVPLPSDVTVVIPVKDRTDGLARLLAALEIDVRGSAAATPSRRSRPGRPARGAVQGSPAGVIVVDDGSADPAAVRAVAERAGAAVLRHPTPRGPAAARNAGLAAAPPRWWRSSTPTSCPSPAGWSRCWRAWPTRRSGSSRRASSRCRRSRGGWAATRPCARRSTSAPTPRWSSRAPASPTSRARPCSSAATPRDAGFDEGMHVAEDVDLVLRLHAAGWRLRYEPAARVAHDHRTSLRAWWLRKAFYGTGAAPLALRHRGAVPPMVLSPWARAHQRAAPARPARRGGSGVGRRRVPPVHQARPPAPPPRDGGPADRARRGRGRRADRRRRHPALLAARRAGRARVPPRPPHRGGRRARQRRPRLVARGPRAARPARVPAGPPPRRPRLRRRPVVGCRAHRTLAPLRPAPPPVQQGHLPCQREPAACTLLDRSPPRGLLRKTESTRRLGSASAASRTTVDPRSRTRSPSVSSRRELGRTAVVAPAHDRRCDVLATTVLRPRGSLWHRYGSPSTA